jgi:glycosyltransferase involved in cell wall biosynthesis
LKILLIHQYYLEASDGGGSRWNEMSRLWAESGHEVTVVAGMVHYAKKEKLEKYKGKWVAVENPHPGIQLIRTHISESYNKNFLGRLWGYFSFALSCSLGGLLKAKGKFDIIVVTSPPLFIGIPALFLSFVKRCPFLFEIRDLWPESAIDIGVLTNPTLIKFAYWFEALVYRRATKINVLTPAFRQVLMERKHIPDDKICFIPNAADFTLSDELLQNFDAKSFRQQHGVDDKFVVLYVGAHGLANHLVQVLDTATLLEDTNVLFWLIGDGMQKNELVSEAYRRELNNVVFFDSVSKKEVFKYILASDVGASILKKADTFKTVYSNKTFDYMSCKKPILMAIDGVSRELVEQAKAGIFVEPENPQDFAEKIKQYINDPHRLISEGENGYAFARNNFDRAVLAKRYLDILENLVVQEDEDLLIEKSPSQT